MMTGNQMAAEWTIAGYPLIVTHDEGVTPVFPDLSDRDEWRARATAEAYAEGTGDAVHFFALPGGLLQLEVVSDRGRPIYASVCAARSMREAVVELDYDDLDRREILAAFGLDAEVVAADPSAPGPFRIWREPCYYTGTYGAPSDGYWRDQEGRITEYVTYDEARAAVREYYTAPSCYDGIPARNVLSHGQAGSDRLVIVCAE